MAGRNRWPGEGPPFPLAFGLLDAGEVGVEGQVIAIAVGREVGDGVLGVPGSSRSRQGGRRSRSASEVLEQLEREPQELTVSVQGRR